MPIRGNRAGRLVAAALTAAGSMAALVAANVGAEGLAKPAPEAPSRSNIAIVGADGTGLRRLTATPDLLYDSPAWSRGGRWIAFSAPPCDDCPERIFLIDLARANRISALPGAAPGAARPSWGPGDRALTYVGGLTNSVFTIGRGGARHRRLTNDPVAHDQSVWSPDGRRILFTGQQPDGGWDLWVMLRDGSHKRRLTATAASDGQPAWSPDGRRIAYARQVGGRWAIFVMPSSGGRATRITPLSDNSQEPAWSPDGRRIAYTRVTTTTSSIVIMTASGTAKRRLRTGRGAASAPSWSPDGRRIAFSTKG